MTPPRAFLSRVWTALRPWTSDRDLDDEIDSHIAEATDEYIARGCSPEEARRAALRGFGGVTQTKEVYREVRSFMWLDDLRQDLRYTARTLVKNPGFALVVILTLALGIGANTAIFTLLDAVVFKPLPVPAAHELLTLYESSSEGAADASGGTGRFLRFSYPRIQLFQQALGTRGAVAAVTRSTRFVARLPEAKTPHFLRAQLVSGNYFETLGVKAARGRALTSPDVGTASPVAVISDGYWNRVLGASDAVIGQTLVVNGVSVTVIGVSPPGFFGIWTDSEADIWLPLTLQLPLRYANNSSGYGAIDDNRPWAVQDVMAWLNVVARVPPGERQQAVAALQQANQQGVAALAALIQDPKSRGNMLAHSLVVEPLSRGFSGLRSRFSDALFALTAMVVLVLLVTCANIANLFLSRAAGRTRDIGIRLSLGAATGRLVRQYLTESLTLALLGGAAGVALGLWASRVLAGEVLGTSGRLPVVFSPDARLLGLGAAMAVATGVLFGLAPAIRAIALARRHAVVTNQRQAIGQGAMRGMRSLVVGQLALSAVIVFAAMLFGRTLANFMHVDPGFSMDRLITVSFDPIVSNYPSNQMPQLGARLVAAAHSVPGVTTAAVSRCGLIAGCSSSGGFKVQGTDSAVTLNENWISADYFLTAGIPILKGRAFDTRDTDHSQRVAIINESAARRYFPGQDPLGLRLGSPQPDTEIVAVVRDAHTQTLHDPPVPMVYFPIEQKSADLQTALTNMDVRYTGDATTTVAGIRDAIRQSEPDLLLDDVAPMSKRLARDLNRERLVTWLAFSFAVLALMLASLGLYGVLSYNVARRTQEIGVRMALGAQRRTVVGYVVGQGARLTVMGLAAGLLGIVAGGRYLAGLLFDVTPLDPATLAAMFLVFLAVTILASYLPARRATRVDPLTALRAE